METLYTYEGFNGPEFVIRYPNGKRSYRCYSLSDPDLLKKCASHLSASLPFNTYTVLATSNHFTLASLKQDFPEYFI